MLEENKASNPLDNNLADPWNSNTSESWTLEGTLTFLGWITLIGGIVAAFLVGVSLKTPEISSYTGYIYDTPHPKRWFYAAGVFMSSLCSGALMLGVGRALKYLQEIKAKLNQ
jgi:hypothetical protein